MKDILCVLAEGEWGTLFTTGAIYKCTYIEELNRPSNIVTHSIAITDDCTDRPSGLEIYYKGRLLCGPNLLNDILCDTEYVYFVMPEDLTDKEMFTYKMTGRLPDEEDHT